MAKPGWYLEKRGKFYGPFQPAKVRAYRESGKLTDTSLIADNPEGSAAQPLSRVWETLDQIGSQPQQTPSEQAETERNEWLVLRPGREFGPYSTGHLRDLIREGKLELDDRVRRDREEPVMLTDLFPELLPAREPEKTRAPEPPPPAEQPPSSPSSETPPPHRATKPAGDEKKSGRTWLGAGILATLAIVLGGLFTFLFRGDLELEESEIANTLIESSKLHQMMRQAELPPFNELARKAVAVGLNFPSREIRNYHATDIDAQTLTEVRGPDGEWVHRDKLETRFWQPFFKADVRSVLRYQTDGQYVFTYLIGSDDLVFAVVIEGPTFARQRLSQTRAEDFAPGARLDRSRLEHQVWTAEIAEGILARAFWQKNKRDHHLHFISVLNDPEAEET